MCELFAMASRFPTQVTLSFETFAQRGGGNAPHADGWGVAFYEDRDVQLLREPAPAVTSPTVRFLQGHPLTSTHVISHVRLATRGDNRLSNTQPFVRELAGRKHVFAHNGHVPGVLDDRRFALRSHRPVGGTDSEHAFCALLSRLSALWAHRVIPSLDARHAMVTAFARDLAQHGPANFIYTDGDAMFVHGHRRTQADGVIRAPGMHVLCRACCDADAAPEGEEQRVVLFASVPLSTEPWRPLDEGEVLAVTGGVLQSTPNALRLAN